MNETEARALLESTGHVVVKAKSHHAAQERQRIAEARMQDAFSRVESVEAWARGECAEVRRLSDRLTFVYGVARAHGATVEDLTSPAHITPDAVARAAREDVAEASLACYYGREGHAACDCVEAEVREASEKAWQEGFKQGGPMHDSDYHDPDAHTRNPYRAAAIRAGEA